MVKKMLFIFLCLFNLLSLVFFVYLICLTRALGEPLNNGGAATFLVMAILSLVIPFCLLYRASKKKGRKK